METTQATLFAEEERKRTRKQETFRRSKSKDGTLSIQFDAELAAKIREHCRITNKNCTKFVSEILEKGLAEAEADMFNTMDRRELIDMIRRLRGMTE